VSIVLIAGQAAKSPASIRAGHTVTPKLRHGGTHRSKTRHSIATAALSGICHEFGAYVRSISRLIGNHVADLPAQDMDRSSTEEWMISLTRTGHHCFIRPVKAVPELDDLIPVLLPMKRLTASTDSEGRFVYQCTFRSSRCVIPGLAAEGAGRAADQVGHRRRRSSDRKAGTPGRGAVTTANRLRRPTHVRLREGSNTRITSSVPIPAASNLLMSGLRGLLRSSALKTAVVGLELGGRVCRAPCRETARVLPGSQHRLLGLVVQTVDVRLLEVVLADGVQQFGFPSAQHDSAYEELKRGSLLVVSFDIRVWVPMFSALQPLSVERLSIEEGSMSSFVSAAALFSRSFSLVSIMVISTAPGPGKGRVCRRASCSC
jgi:hypothetical protein